MNRIIKANEVKEGYLQGHAKKVVANQNLNPSFEASEKPWKLKKVLKTDTKVIPWLIEYDGIFYVAKQYFRHRLGETVDVFLSTSKGKIETIKPVYNGKGYVDIETVVDLFVEQLLLEKFSANIESSEDFNNANQTDKTN